MVNVNVNYQVNVILEKYRNDYRPTKESKTESHMLASRACRIIRKDLNKLANYPMASISS
jgi:hypothetical protein